MDNKSAIEFVKRWHPDGPWLVMGINSDTKDLKHVYAEHEQDLRDFIERHNGVLNLYFQVNRLSGPPKNGKSSKTDVSSVDWLHVDVDPRAGEDIKKEQERALRLLQEYEPKPTVIVFSGGGYQGFWKLKTPVEIGGDVEKAQDAERYNQKIELDLGADNCHNVDRIMRIPGTRNLPNEKKRRQGRQVTEAKLIEWHEDRVYEISEFPQQPIKTQTTGPLGFTTGKIDLSGELPRFTHVDELEGVSDSIKILILQGENPNAPKQYGSRSESLFAACCEMVRAGMDDKSIYSVITNKDFLISQSVLDKKTAAQRYAARQIQRAREAAGEGGSPELMELNEKHAVISDIGGKCRIVSEVFDVSLQRRRISKQSFADFRNRYGHRKVTVGKDEDGKTKTKELGLWWTKNPMRRQYDTIVFAPNQDPENAYNLWKGFACEAVSGDCSLFLEHIHDNIASGNKDLEEYVLNWLARAVQHPDTQGCTALVLRGRQGTGKSIFAKVFGSLFGHHFMQVSDAKHLTGNFNAHLRDAVVVLADEAFFAGDKVHTGVLKTLITEEFLVVEPKGVDSEVAPNYIHLIMASNHEWVVPANADERRFCVLDVGDGHIQDSQYFGKMMQQMDNGGREALLDYLLKRDISKFVVHNVPQTKALLSQKVESMDSQESWLYGCLQDGIWLDDQETFESFVECSSIHENYVEHSMQVGDRRRVTSQALGEFLNKVVGARKVRKRAQGGKRTYVYQFPSLKECRERFDLAKGGPFVWQDVGAFEPDDPSLPF